MLKIFMSTIRICSSQLSIWQKMLLRAKINADLSIIEDQKLNEKQIVVIWWRWDQLTKSLKKS